MSKTFIGIWLILLFITAAWLHVRGVGTYYYSEDEAMHMGIAGASSLKEALRFSLYESHPPLGHMIRFYWLKTDDSIAFSRCLSLLFGLALIPLYYAVGNMLGGRLAGMFSAGLIAFSYGCGVQSYVARNYTIYLFLLSCGFYGYWLWRERKRPYALTAYFIFSALACLTHFAALLAVFTIAVFECVRMWRANSKLGEQAAWAGVNLAIAAITLCVFYVWKRHGFLIEDYFTTDSALALPVTVIANPLATMAYLLPRMECVPFLMFLLFAVPIRRHPQLWQFLGLSLIAFAIGMVLVALRQYYPGGTRHGMWVLPFAIPATAWILAIGMERLQEKYGLGQWHAAAFILLAGLALFDGGKLEKEHTEFQTRIEDWRGISDYLERLDSKTAIVAARDDAILLTNIYPYLGDNVYDDRMMAMRVPYRHTHLLVNPYFRRTFLPSILAATLAQAQEKHLLDGIDTLIFMKTLWDSTPEPLAPLPHLAVCRFLPMQVISFPTFAFPDLPQGITISAEEKRVRPVAFLSISKKDFFDQVLSPQGKAHGCLE